MHFIQKKDIPICFKNKSLKWIKYNYDWKKLKNPCKNNVFTKLLIDEQNNLCGYCEKLITDSKDAHIEHIKPKYLSASSRFDYNNLIVSCNGINTICDSSISKTQRKKLHSCGHKKNNCYDENLFLNPTIERNLEKYLKYDNSTGQIIATGFANNKAKYTIEILNLDNERLNLARLSEAKALNKSLIAKGGDTKTYLKILLNKPQAYISFLRNYYKAYL